MTISPEERAALRAQHSAPWCQWCDSAWPCVPARLLDALEAAEQRVADLEELRDWTPGRRTKSRVPAIAEDPVREETNG